MLQKLYGRALIVVAILIAASTQQAAAQSMPSTIGIVIMHGKGGSPTKHVTALASALERKGYLVANLEMPWSGQRNYDVNVAGAEREVDAALSGLRAKGAANLFVAGHSQGGLFALYFGGRHVVDGIVAIAPGGNTASMIAREKLSGALELARKLDAEGRGNDTATFLDYEGSKGAYPIFCTPAIYLGWFDPDGAMNQPIAAANMNPGIPVLLIAPKNDYPGLAKAKQSTFNALPAHPLTRLYEPDSDHLAAPSASVDEIVRWTAEVSDKANTARQAASASSR